MCDFLFNNNINAWNFCFSGNDEDQGLDDFAPLILRQKPVKTSLRSKFV